MVRKHTIMLAIAVSALLFSCTYPFDNPADPEGNDYQGWTVSDDPAKLELALPADGAEIAYNLDYCDLVCSEIVGQTAYSFQIAEDEEFETVVEEGIVDEHTYTFYPSSLDQGETYYWRVKVGSALYTDSRSFSLSELVIGDSFGGGIVFYLDGAGGGLVCAEHDQGIDIEWGESGTDIGGDDNSSAPELEGVGSGLANTEAIVAALGDNGGTPYAAKICYDLDLNGYTDWFLPSAEELTLMYEDLHLQGYGDFRSEDYWSSTENTSSYAWWHDFGSSNHGISLKFNEYCVRAVRAF